MKIPFYNPYNPRPFRRCYFCGTNTLLPRWADDFLLAVLPNGRSYNYCRKHWKLFRTVACPSTIEEHRCKFLKDTNRHDMRRLSEVIRSLAFMEKNIN